MRFSILLVLACAVLLLTTVAALDDQNTLRTIQRIESDAGDTQDYSLLFVFLNLIKNLATGQAKAVQPIPANVPIKEAQQYIEKPTLMAVILNKDKQAPKRKEGEDYVVLEDELRSIEKLEKIFIPYANKAISMLEKSINVTSGHKLSLGVLTQDLYTLQKAKDLWAIYDISEARMLIRYEFYEYLISEVNGLPAIDEIDAQYVKLLDNMPKSATMDEMTRFIGNIPSILQQSVWTCLGCTIVLGTALPLVYNYVIDQISQVVCKYYKMSDVECDNLRIDALGFAAILMFPSAFIVFKVCIKGSCLKPAAHVLSRIVGPSVAASIAKWL
ncbi:NADH-quinone oxidoreductase subunit D [Acrasis kona]|uniref:NADH-quinone oxidoreductase subunit D n=1 Tax=Acrasis kona TaxID=1008807 RepID=A0AAW2ZLY5_9EUKA